MLLGPERAGMSQEAIDAHYGIKRTTWADRERRRKRQSKRISQAEDKQAIVEQLRNDPAAALEQLRDRSPARGRAYAVRRAFVTEHGGLRPVSSGMRTDPGSGSELTHPFRHYLQSVMGFILSMISLCFCSNVSGPA